MQTFSTLPPQKNVTLGDMLEFWTKRGSFNIELYRRISQMKTSK
jgi:hypothetical protein